MKVSLSCLVIFLFLFAAGCSDQQDNPAETTIVQPINPNGDSELALLMRDMFDDGMRLKADILAGNTPEILVEHGKMLTAQATQPQKVATEKYRDFAEAYRLAAEALLSTQASERPARYQQLVAACMQCHTSICPGPMVKIKKMYLSEKELLTLSQE